MAPLPHTFNIEPRYKEQFARFLHDGFSPFVAALKLWPDDAGLASRVSELWVQDEYVVACREKLRETEEAKNKPTSKEAQIKRIEAKLTSMRDEDYLKAERLIAEMSGHIEKAAPASVNVNANTTFERVMIVKDHGSDEDWEDKVYKQQQKLIEGARA